MTEESVKTKEKRPYHKSTSRKGSKYLKTDQIIKVGMPTKTKKAARSSIPKLERTKLFVLGLPVTLTSRMIPWGYKQSTTNKKMCEPVEELLNALVKAKLYITSAEYSYEAIAEWITKATGVYLSGPGLCKILHARAPDNRVATLTIEERWKLYYDSIRRPDSEEESKSKQAGKKEDCSTSQENQANEG